jgi:hypothetical protein
MVCRLAKETMTMFLTVLPLGFVFSVIPWSAFLTLAPGPDNTKAYYISSVRHGERCGRGQGRGRLNCRGWLRATSARFIIVRKMLIVVGAVVAI